MALIDYANSGLCATRQSTTSTTYTNLSGTGYTALTSSAFTAGKKYLIYGQALVAHSSSSTNKNFGIRMLHGSTVFAHSEFVLEPGFGGADHMHSYRFFDVWTAVASEGIDFEYRSSTTTTTYADRFSVYAINLTDDLTEGTDWEFNRNTSSTALTGSPVTFATITVDAATPNNGNWLVLSCASMTPGSLTDSYEMRLNSTGDVADSVFSRREGERTDNLLNFHRSRGYALTSNGNTFNVQCFEDGSGSGTHNGSSVFALNLEKFKASGISETLGTAAFTGGFATPTYTTTIFTFDFDPTMTADTFMNAEYWSDLQSGANHSGWYTSLQVAGADKPSDQQTDGYHHQRTQDSSDAWALALSWIEDDLTSGSKTIRLIGEEDDEDDPGVADYGERIGWAFTLELAGGAGPQTGIAGTATIGVIAQNTDRTAGPVTGVAETATIGVISQDTERTGVNIEPIETATIGVTAQDTDRTAGPVTGVAETATIGVLAQATERTAGPVTGVTETATIGVTAQDTERLGVNIETAETATIGVTAQDTERTPGPVTGVTETATIGVIAQNVIGSLDGGAQTGIAGTATVGVTAQATERTPGPVTGVASTATIGVIAQDTDRTGVNFATAGTATVGVTAQDTERTGVNIETIEVATIGVLAQSVTAAPGPVTAVAETATIGVLAQGIISSFPPELRIKIANKVTVTRKVTDSVVVTRKVAKNVTLGGQ